MRFLAIVPVTAILILISGCPSDGSGPELPDLAYHHIRPAWSPDGQYVAFTSTAVDAPGIYRVDSAGTGVELVHAGDALGITWSPDGQSIAFQQTNLIYRVSLSVDNPEVLVSTAPSLRPSWSPDGQRIVYVRDGLRLLRLSDRFDTQISTSGESPSWRPDASLVFDVRTTVDALSNAYEFALLVVSADSVYQELLFSFESFDACDFFSLTPDGQYAVYSRRDASGIPQIRSIFLLTGSDIALTNDGGDTPALSVDGEWIAYTRTASDDGGLWKMRINGTDRKRLTTP